MQCASLVFLPAAYTALRAASRQHRKSSSDSMLTLTGGNMFVMSACIMVLLHNCPELTQLEDEHTLSLLSLAVALS